MVDVNYKNSLIKEEVEKEFKDNKRMIDICSQIENISVYFVIKLAYGLKMIYPHIENISLEKNYQTAKQKLKEYIISNQTNYYEIIESCDDKIKEQIFQLEMNEQNLNIAKVIATAKDQFEAYNIRRAYQTYYTNIPDKFYEGIGLPETTTEIWYVSPEKHKQFLKVLKKG